MKPQRGGQQHLERDPKVQSTRSGAGRLPTGMPLTAEESGVLECLQDVATGLTARQIGVRVSCDPGVVEQALTALMEREMVVRLNTVVPSYSLKRRDPGIHAE